MGTLSFKFNVYMMRAKKGGKKKAKSRDGVLKHIVYDGASSLKDDAGII